jgi:hypothetical protein
LAPLVELAMVVGSLECRKPNSLEMPAGTRRVDRPPLPLAVHVEMTPEWQDTTGRGPENRARPASGAAMAHSTKVR